MTERDRDIRNVRMHRDLWEGEGLALRTHDGRLISIEWGEPDADGFYTPVFTAHEPSELQRTEWRVQEARADLAAAIVAAVEGLPKGKGQAKPFPELSLYHDIEVVDVADVLNAIREAAK